MSCAFRLRCIDKLGFAFRRDVRLPDVGCGDGGVATLLADRVGEVMAVDLERSSGWQDAPALSFLVADEENLPFDDGLFDVVHPKDLLHHMDHPDRALAEYLRIHFVPGAGRVLGLQHAVEEALERFRPVRSLLSYNFAVAVKPAADAV